MSTRTVKTVLAMGVLATTLGAGSALAGAATTPSRASTHLTALAAKTSRVAFKGSYTGTISLLWSSTGVSVTGLHGSGTTTLLGKASVTGTGSGTAASTCNPFSGTGTISAKGSTLKLKVVSSTKQQACAAGSAAPTLVSVTGYATANGGTGKYKGAKGTLALKGTFSIQSTTAGSSESDSFTASLTGSLTVLK
jgi:hypothetical protein